MDKMKNSGMSETMQTLTRKSACVVLSLLLLLSAVLPVKAAAETASAKVVRVGSFEDTFNYVNEKGDSASITSGSVPIRTPIFLPFSVLKSEAVMSSRERSA